jgi:hypothetical protein
MACSGAIDDTTNNAHAVSFGSLLSQSLASRVVLLRDDSFSEWGLSAFESWI